MKKVTATLTVLLFFRGCESYPENPLLEKKPPPGSYSFANRSLGEGNSDEHFIVLSLSVGGLRAAALGYGVLRYLESLRIPGGGTLLDEVDVITSSN